MLVRHFLCKIPEMKNISNAVLFLLSNKASMITGINLPVDNKSKIPNVNIIAVDLVDWDATRKTVEEIYDMDLLVIALYMITRSSNGSFINVSKINGLRPFEILLSYCFSKTGMDMMTKVLTLELGPHNSIIDIVKCTMSRLILIDGIE
ncbi:hypothetical protein KUTeg_005637 [Tegillarca granosa]|uniref:Uncharacterized protein n=1 Tax=Tegillarca granosa TaxID=220873 RepID=A0ABQ9FKA7_TEGGR|nr:hypothetical protein KUTeg_005637 [Tegillarca granosa]